MAKSLPLLVLAALAVLGCSSKDGDLSKTDQATLRNNFTRGLTPAEIEHMKNAPPVEMPKSR